MFLLQIRANCFFLCVCFRLVTREETSDSVLLRNQQIDSGLFILLATGRSLEMIFSLSLLFVPYLYYFLPPMCPSLLRCVQRLLASV